MEYEKQNEMMEFKQEMMDDVMDEAFGAEDEEEKTDDMVQQVLDEVGIGLGASMASAPMSLAQREASPAAEETDLQGRLNQLRSLK